MLVGYSVKNYKSFKNHQYISFMKGKSKAHDNHVIKQGDKELLKCGLIFGANASGKSNFIHSIEFSRTIILKGIDNVDVNKCHFRIDSDMLRSPAVFEYRILIDEAEYSYGIVISYNEKIILGEWLSKINSDGSETCIFNREVDDNGDSHSSSDLLNDLDDESRMKMKFFLDGFSKNISEEYKKKSLLSDIAQRVNEQDKFFSQIKKVYKWFEEILIISPSARFSGLNKLASDENSKRFFSLLMKYFDTGITGIDEGEIDFDDIINKLPKEMVESIKIDISNLVTSNPVTVKINDSFYDLFKDNEGNIISKKLLLDHGNSKDMFDYNDESDGTQRLFDLVPLFTVANSYSPIIIDEIDRSMHSSLTRKYIEMYLSNNKTKQLIATTHDTNLLDLDLLRKDEIWFVKRANDNSSEIYSLNSFKLLLDNKQKIDTDYLIGRYGAVPLFNETLMRNLINE